MPGRRRTSFPASPISQIVTLFLQARDARHHYVTSAEKHGLPLFVSLMREALIFSAAAVKNNVQKWLHAERPRK
jgi:hypothetical protein